MCGIKNYPRTGILRLGEPLGGSRGNPAGRGAGTGIEKLKKNPLGKPSQGTKQVVDIMINYLII